MPNYIANKNHKGINHRLTISHQVLCCSTVCAFVHCEKIIQALFSITNTKSTGWNLFVFGNALAFRSDHSARAVKDGEKRGRNNPCFIGLVQGRGCDVTGVRVTSRAARQAALATELGVRRRELGAAVVAKPTGTGRPAAAAATSTAAATHVAAAVSLAGTDSAASRHRARRTVAVAGAVAVRAVAAARLAEASIGTVTGRRHDASSADVASAGVLRAAAITTS